jgi:hypothetical protein
MPDQDDYDRAVVCIIDDLEALLHRCSAREQAGNGPHTDKVSLMKKSVRGGPTEKYPNRRYCKDDQSCCDFCCGN